MTEDARQTLRQILGLPGGDVTDEEVALFRDHNIVRRATRNELIKTAIANGEAIQCPECQMISWNPHDVRELYCGNCHAPTSRSDWHLIKELLTRLQSAAVVLPPVMVNLAGTPPAETPPQT